MSPLSSARHARLAHILTIALLTLLGAGCDESTEIATSETATTAPTQQAQTGLAYLKIKWLDVGSTIPPEQWLASRAAKTELPADNPRVESLRVELAKAGQLFVEDPRMIANRAVQLEEMLASQGIDESATDLLGTLMPFGSTRGPRQVFGSVGQHYFNLRQQGLDRDAAVQRLQQGAFRDLGSTKSHG